MSMMRFAVAALAGLFGGMAFVLIGCMVTGAVALSSGRPARLPFVFDATPGRLNGAAELSFQPHGAGMLVVVVVCAVLSGLLAVIRRAPEARVLRLGGSS